MDTELSNIKPITTIILDTKPMLNFLDESKIQ
jgi:hypothetical protein